jgi:hypothetical protein
MKTASKLLLVAALAASFGAAQAQQRPGHPAPAPHFGGNPGHNIPARPGGLHFDDRYQHNHWYPGRGYVFGRLPPGAVRVGWGRGDWWYQGGVWFRPWGPRWVVGVPPLGIVVPYLPPAYVSLTVGDVPYYYANGVYYTGAPEGYVVVNPPATVAQAAPVPVSPPPTLIIYPRDGQTTAQAESDRAACNDWAGAQPGGRGDAATFQRGFATCMEGRGYTVK